MSLTATDLDQIREVIYVPLRKEMNEGFAELNREVGYLSSSITRLEETVEKFDGRISANENDIKDTYYILDTKADIASTE